MSALRGRFGARGLERPREPEDERRWRAHLEGAVEKLRAEGVTVVGDLDAGAAHYVALRQQWGPYVVAFAAYMAYDWDEVAAQETGEAA